MTLLLRTAFVAMIVAGLAAQVMELRRIGQTAPVRTAVVAAALQLGLVVDDDGDASRIVLTAPGCASPVMIDVLRLDGREDTIGDELPRQAQRFVFLGAVQKHIDRFALRGRWLLANILFVIGVRPSKPGTEVLEVILPESCPRLLDANWARLSPW